MNYDTIYNPFIYNYPLRKEISIDEIFKKGNYNLETYKGYKNYSPSYNKKDNTPCGELMLEIQKHYFYFHELVLRLDVNPFNKELVKKAECEKRKINQLIEKYNSQCGAICPLCSYEKENGEWSLNKKQSPWVY